jgi:crotonyl-CoA carboxylase/reductase
MCEPHTVAMINRANLEEHEMTTQTTTRPTSAAIRVADVMHRGVLTCARDESLSTVAELMVQHRVHCVVVTDNPDQAGALWGVVSDLDLVAAASVRGLDDQLAGATAATAALTISPGETLQRAAQLMTEHGTAHLVVVDTRTLRPVGVLSTLDVARALSRRG